MLFVFLMLLEGTRYAPGDSLFAVIVIFVRIVLRFMVLQRKTCFVSA